MNCTNNYHTLILLFLNLTRSFLFSKLILCFVSIMFMGYMTFTRVSIVIQLLNTDGIRRTLQVMGVVSLQNLDHIFL